jgi:hypothetical protein
MKNLVYCIMYTYEKFNLRLFPLFLLIIGTGFTITGNFIEGGIFGTFGAIFTISFKGFQIDPQKNLIRKYDRFYWVYLGKWQKFPPPLYVTVVRIKLNNSRNSPLPMPSAGNSKPSKSHKMNLVVDGKERYIPLTYGKRNKMLEEGLKIARTLNIKLLDHTTIEKVWFT